MNKKNIGYTLIELLIVVAILGTVGFTATQIFFTVLQSTAKADLTREVKQNGDYAISNMEKMIRNAKSVSCGSGAIILENFETPATQTTFNLSGTVPQQIASSSAFIGGASTSQGMLTNTKVSASALSFNCNSVAGKPDLVTISFTLSQANATAARPEERASMNFQTTVSLRNY